MYVFDLEGEKEFSPEKHVEKILQVVSGGDVTIACWNQDRKALITSTQTPLKFIFATKVVGK